VRIERVCVYVCVNNLQNMAMVVENNGIIYVCVCCACVCMCVCCAY